MPDLDTTGWELESAEQRHAQHPDRFEIPSRAERSSLLQGQMVKLLFLFLNEENGKPIVDCERMWVTITSTIGDRYVGLLESIPATSQVLRAGDVVEFGPEHVCSVFIPRGDRRHPDHPGR